MSNKTNYKRLKKKLEVENMMLFNENLFHKQVIKIVKEIMSEEQNKELKKKIEEYLK